jgi:hypothetical protein
LHIELDKKRGDPSLFSVYNDGEKKNKKKEVTSVAIITQKKLFVWKEIEDLGDLERLYLVLNYLPDEKLMLCVGRREG